MQIIHENLNIQCVVLETMRGKKELKKALLFLHKMQKSLIIVYLG